MKILSITRVAIYLLYDRFRDWLPLFSRQGCESDYRHKQGNKMSIWDLDKLYLFIAFVIPGFISIKAYEVVIPGRIGDSSKQIVDAVAYSCLNYALLLWPIMAIEASSIKEQHPNWYAAFYLFVLFIAPIIWVLIWKAIRTTRFFQRNAPHPTLKPWDYVFSKRKPYWVKITLNDGTRIAGKYGTKSFASSAPAPEQLYLEETWLLNEKGGFDRAKRQTAGTIVLSGDISYIELLDFYPEQDNG